MEVFFRIYYFSGTGNSERTSQWIKETALHYGITTELVNIANIKRRNLPPPPENAIIGFCAPTHGFNFPPIMMHFLLHFPRAKNKVFILNTRAGLKLSKLFIPGVSGMAQYFSALVLFSKGYKIRGMHPIDLPSNWISLHPGLKEKVVASIHQRWQNKTTQFTHRIIHDKTDYRALITLPLDFAISPVALMYYLGGRFIIAKSFYADSSCDYCGLCIRECPVQAIKSISNRPFWTFNCESCMHCMNRCPKRAIQTAHGYFIATLVLVNLVAMPLVWKIISTNSSLQLDSTAGRWMDLAIWTLICLLIYAISYRLMHSVLRIPLFRELIEYSSLTRFHFWRRYKYPSAKSKNNKQNP